VSSTPHPLLIARMDQLSRSDELRGQLERSDWDLVVVDEAHRMSAHYFGGELKTTRRYQLGQLLGRVSRHLLLMTATPHAGKQEDFQLFLALLDGDRFEGRYRDGVHAVRPDDLMRRMVKEELLTMDGRPLFPERRAYSVPYELSTAEQDLYEAVTQCVREEMNRAERLRETGDGRRGNTVGFALTVLQRRLASSPEAILWPGWTGIWPTCTWPATSNTPRCTPAAAAAPTSTTAGCWPKPGWSCGTATPVTPICWPLSMRGVSRTCSGISRLSTTPIPRLSWARTRWPAH
jgi:hypothetical protein